MLLSIHNSSPKILVLALALLSCMTFYAQKEKNKTAPFIRVYDLHGTKISKGRIARITDTSLVVSRGEKPFNLELSKIGFIKTKRSAGNNILYGASIGAGTGAILGLALGGEDEFWGKGEAAGGAGLFMGVVGAGVGAITAIFKKPKTFSIEGKHSNLKAFQEAMDE
ncbi:MAG: hypothetical protein KJO53_15180 [Eudoraea sp.]|nr:hypothetical protein [Eudoraea sp.]MBT8294369.1 hypothetical protein [Eudoraea sp.]